MRYVAFMNRTAQLGKRAFARSYDLELNYAFCIFLVLANYQINKYQNMFQHLGEKFAMV